jgi:hypothetical protein
MKMVVTLRSGVQIKADVESYSTGSSPIAGDLRQLKWTTAENPSVTIEWLAMSEVVAVHTEFDYKDRTMPHGPRATRWPTRISAPVRLRGWRPGPISSVRGGRAQPSEPLALAGQMPRVPGNPSLCATPSGSPRSG